MYCKDTFGQLTLETLFKRPHKRLPVLSSDGKSLAFVMATQIGEEIILRDVATGVEKSIALLEDSHVMELKWLYDNRTLYFIKDHHGNENFRLYTLQTDLFRPRVEEHTPFDIVYVKEVHLDEKSPRTIHFSMNKDNPQAHDAYVLDLDANSITKLFENNGRIIQYAYRDSEVAAYIQQEGDDTLELWAKGTEKHAFEKIFTWGIETFFFNQMIGFNESGDSLYMLEAESHNTTSVSLLNTVSHSLSVIINDPKYDCDHVIFSPGSATLEAVGIISARNSYHALSGFERDYQRMNEAVGKEYYVVSLAKDGCKILKTVDFEGRVQHVLWHSSTGQLEVLFSDNEALEHYDLSPIEAISFTARDGVTLEGYLSRPLNQVGPFPLVVNVHGGPWGRDIPGYIANEAIWLSSRGYASLYINFRGSTGYGKHLFSLGRHQWGKNMQNDLIDGLNWAIEKGISTPDNASIFGMSYGGYSVLAAAAFTPDVFCCGVDRVGPSNVIRILEDMPPQWGVNRKAFYYNVGDPLTERELLYAASPLFHVDAIKMPLFIAQGRNDPRVKVSESEDIVKALKDKNLPHEYMIFEDEGHIFVKEANVIAFYAAAECFLDYYHKK